MNISQNVFHTKHDFTPEFAWAAFQLLVEVGQAGISSSDLLNIAKMIGSPLAKRADLNKLLAGFQDIELIYRVKDKIYISDAGNAIANSLGNYEKSFYVAIHCMYFWKWIWDKEPRYATPSWSYRQVCKEILNKGLKGIDSDEIVIRILTSGEKFNTDKISFSRSSVRGVTVWLEAQTPPLIRKKGEMIYLQNCITPMPDLIRLNLAALCAVGNGEAILDFRNLQLLSEALLMPSEEILRPLIDYIKDSNEFMLINGTLSKVKFKDSNDSFINWIMNPNKYNCNKNDAGAKNEKLQ